MNKTISQFARQQIKDGLARLQDKHHLLFKRMYSPQNLDAPIDVVVDSMEDNKLDWALTQVERTLARLSCYPTTYWP